MMCGRSAVQPVELSAFRLHAACDTLRIVGHPHPGSDALGGGGGKALGEKYTAPRWS